jgi:hypothetical protein
LYNDVPVLDVHGHVSVSENLFYENPARVIPAFAKSSSGGTTPRTRSVSDAVLTQGTPRAPQATLSDTHHG